MKDNKIINTWILDDVTNDLGFMRTHMCFRKDSSIRPRCYTQKDLTYSLGPQKKDAGVHHMACFRIVFLALMFEVGYLGYQDGLPTEEELADKGDNKT